MKATTVIHWPTGPVHVCDEHAQDLQTIAAIIGPSLSCSASDGRECRSCELEREDAPGDAPAKKDQVTP